MSYQNEKVNINLHQSWSLVTDSLPSSLQNRTRHCPDLVSSLRPSSRPQLYVHSPHKHGRRQMRGGPPVWVTYSSSHSVWWLTLASPWVGRNITWSNNQLRVGRPLSPLEYHKWNSSRVRGVLISAHITLDWLLTPILFIRARARRRRSSKS